MRQLSAAIIIALATVSAGLFSGCAGEDTAEAPSPVPSPAPAASPPAVVIPSRPPAPPRLTQPTNPDQRVTQVTRGRNTPLNDPFTTVSVVPRYIPPSPSPGAAPGAVPRTSPQVNLPALPNLPNQGQGNEPTLPIAPALPPLPEPTLAQATEVTGIVQLGNGDFRIVLKAPQEQGPRYVRVGDRISNGQVLVKRVESIGGNQVVVLEEIGIEVRRAVGDSATAQVGSRPNV